MDKLEKALVYGVGAAAVVNIAAKILARQHRQSTTRAEEVQWNLPTPVSPTVRSLDEFLDGMSAISQKHRQRQISALSPEDRAVIDARLAGGITKRELGNLITRMAEKE